MEEDKESNLEKLLRVLTATQPAWAIIFEPDFDKINEIVEGDLNTVLEKIRYSLMIEKRGFIFLKKTHLL